MGAVDSEFQRILDTLLEEKSQSPLSSEPHTMLFEPIPMSFWTVNQMESITQARGRSIFQTKSASAQKTNTTSRFNPPRERVRKEKTRGFKSLSISEQKVVIEFFKLVGQPPTDTLKEFEIRKLYRKLARQLHPDSQVQAHKTESAGPFRKLQSLYEQLQKLLVN